MNFLETFLKNYGLALIAILLFGLLVAKNPFSSRNLIANFEPFPDSFYYVTTPKCWLSGQGWRLCREGRAGIQSATPPLYSIVLLPGFVLYRDARMFYFTNVLLALLGLGVFYLLVSKLFKQTYIQFFCLVAYVTSYHLYWLPTLAMAENLLQTIFLLSLWLLLQKYSKKILFAQVAIALSFVATKYAAAPLAMMSLLIIAVKFLRKVKINKLFILVLGLGILTLAWTFGLLINGIAVIQNIAGGKQNSNFSSYYFLRNINFYWNTLLGGNTTFLWDHQALYPAWLAIAAVLGFGISFLRNHKKSFILSILLLLIGQISFMSFFYVADARYILPVISACLLGLGFFLTNTHDLYKKINKLSFFYTLILIISLIVASTFAIRVKSQISLNLRYAETPWWYLSVLQLNSYFAQPAQEKPVVVTAISPFLIDYYSNNNYEVLPLSAQQDFRGHKVAVWGPNDYSDLIALYKHKLEENREVYVINYGLGHEADKIASYKRIQDSFSLELVQSGCYDLCNLYRLHL